MEIKNIFGDVLFALEGAKTVCELVTAAVAAKKSLTGANLRGANLTGANLRDANLTDAYLRGANLTGANLTDAYLRGANLTGANLTGANLTGANLRDANLRGANLTDAYLRGARESFEGVPVIPNIHQAVFEAASKPEALDMGNWHSCETTHCRAGWVVTLAGEGGRALEWALGTPAAAAVIYLASDPKLEKVPNFYAGNEVALDDMKRLAELEASRGQ